LACGRFVSRSGCHLLCDRPFCESQEKSRRSEQPGLKYQQPPRDDRKDDQAEVVHFKLSFTSFHHFSPSQGAFLNLLRGLDVSFVSLLRKMFSQLASILVTKSVGLAGRSVLPLRPLRALRERKIISRRARKGRRAMKKSHAELAKDAELIRKWVFSVQSAVGRR